MTTANMYVTYRGFRREGKVVVTVDEERLPPRNDLFNHSPDGFEFGYGGSGPAQTALAILADHFGRMNDVSTVEHFWCSSEAPTADGFAVKYHQPFKHRAIRPIEGDEFTMTTADVSRWIDEIVRQRDTLIPKANEAENAHPCINCAHILGQHASEKNERGVIPCLACPCGHVDGKDPGYQDDVPEMISRAKSTSRIGQTIIYNGSKYGERMEQVLERIAISAERSNELCEHMVQIASERWAAERPRYEPMAVDLGPDATTTRHVLIDESLLTQAISVIEFVSGDLELADKLRKLIANGGAVG